MLLYDQNDCEFYEVVVDIINDFREKHHRTSCKKCSYKSQAGALNIMIHEWPLPKNPLEAKSVVFELQPPSFFGHWRDVTFYFKLDVLKYKYKRRNCRDVNIFLELTTAFHPSLRIPIGRKDFVFCRKTNLTELRTGGTSKSPLLLRRTFALTTGCCIKLTTIK